MSLSITENWESGSGTVGKDGRDTYRAIVTGTAADNADDPRTVTLYALQHFSLVSSQGNILVNMERERIAPFTWQITAMYESPTRNRQTNDANFSFTTGGGTQHITCARQHIADYDTEGDAGPNHGGSIGVTNDSIEGVEIHVPSFDFKITYCVPSTQMTTNYVAKLYTCTGNVNTDDVTIQVRSTALTFKAGELLFLGAEASERSGFADWELTLNFSASPNQTDVPVGQFDSPEPIAKKGWEYLWVEYQAQTDSGNNFVQAPVAVHIEKVYPETALQGLMPSSTVFNLASASSWNSLLPTLGVQIGSPIN